MSGVTSAEREEWAVKYRQGVAPYVGTEGVEAVGVFERQSRFWTDPGVPISMYLIGRSKAKKKERRLFDLPQSFLLAVTGDKVYALSYTKTRKKFEVKDQVADFDRKSVSLSKTERGRSADTVFTVTEGGQSTRIKLKSNTLSTDENPWAAEVVAALSE